MLRGKLPAVASVPPDKVIFTTGDVASLCGVASRTVSKWVDSGRLPGYRLPGSNDRRVRRLDLQRFLTEANMQDSLALLTAAAGTCWLLAGVPRWLAEAAEAAAAASGVKVMAEAGLWAAAVAFERHRPAAVALGTYLGMAEVTAAVAHLAALPNPPRLVAVVPEDVADFTALTRAGCAVALRGDCAPAVFVGCLAGEQARPRPGEVA